MTEEIYSIGYWKTDGRYKVIESITYVQRDVLTMVAAFGDKGLRLHNHDIGQQLLLNSRYVGEIINELKRAGWVVIDKAHSPHRVIYWSDKTKAIPELRTRKNSKSTSSDSRQWNKSTSSPDRQLLPATADTTSSEDRQCTISKEVKQVKGGASHNLPMGDTLSNGVGSSLSEVIGGSDNLIQPDDDLPWNPNHPNHLMRGLPTAEQAEQLLKDAAHDD